jgi:iron complex outermembrane receptor protein
VRPLPFNDRTPANFPTQILSQPLNTAVNTLEGLDIELNYNFTLQDIFTDLPGDISVRTLATLQPVNQAIQFPGAPLTFQAYPKARLSAFVTYRTGKWSVDILDRWISGFKQAIQMNQVYADPRLPATNYIDFNINRRFDFDHNGFDVYLSVENLFDQRPRVNPSTTNANPGLYFMGVQGVTANLYDAVGRYFTIGMKWHF